jgi:hypothetical protein
MELWKVWPKHVQAFKFETSELCTPAVLRIARSENFSHCDDPSEKARRFFIVSSFSLLEANSVSYFFSEQILQATFCW